MVTLGSIVESDGNLSSSVKNKVAFTLINIEKETAKQFYNSRNRTLKEQFIHEVPEERYNLDLLLSSNFDNYKEALTFLEEGMLFFQTYPSFNKTTFSNMPKGISRLDLEMDNISYHEMHSLWTSLGAKYRPSVIYKARLITLSENRIQAVTPLVKETTNTAKLQTQ